MFTDKETLERRKSKLALTPDQQKAWNAFKRAVKKCEKSGIKFYTVLETVHAVNNKHLHTIHDGDGAEHLNMQDSGAPSICNFGFSGWADDIHYAEFIDE